MTTGFVHNVSISGGHPAECPWPSTWRRSSPSPRTSASAVSRSFGLRFADCQVERHVGGTDCGYNGIMTRAGPGPGPKLLPGQEASTIIARKMGVYGSAPPRGFL
jgi:hypothetical protein